MAVIRNTNLCIHCRSYLADILRFCNSVASILILICSASVNLFLLFYSLFIFIFVMDSVNSFKEGLDYLCILKLLTKVKIIYFCTFILADCIFEGAFSSSFLFN